MHWATAALSAGAAGRELTLSYGARMANGGGAVGDVVASLGDSLLPGLGPPVRGLLRSVQAEWARNGSVALQAAEAASGLTREELTEALRAAPRLHPLLTRLLFSAGMNGYDPVLRAMGTALGQAVTESAQVDECELILTALADLNAAHGALLRLLNDPPDRAPEGDGSGYWTQETLLAAAAFSERAGELVLAALISRGLAAIPPMALGTPVQITALGRVVLDVLDEWKHASS